MGIVQQYQGCITAIKGIMAHDVHGTLLLTRNYGTFRNLVTLHLAIGPYESTDSRISHPSAVSSGEFLSGTFFLQKMDATPKVIQSTKIFSGVARFGLPG